MSKFVDQKRRSFFRKRQKIHPLPSIIGSVRNSDHAKGAGGVFLHYEIFLDLLFAENLLLNYTILRLSSFLLKRSATRRRSFAAAALGASYAVLYAVFARYLPGALLALVGIGITTGMVKSGCRITTVRDLVVGMAGYILSGFLIGSAYRLFRELMPGRGIFLFLLSGSAAYAGTLLLLKIRKEILLEHARQVTVQLVQNGKWKKVKGASGYTIYKKVVKNGTKAKKAKKIKFMKVKNVSAKTTKFTIKLKKKATTSFYIKAFVKTKVNGKTKTVYGKASNTKKVKVK